jgi:hypothetical protein
MILADFRVAGRLEDFKAMEISRVMVVVLLPELQEAGTDKSRFHFKNQSENLWLAKKQKVTIASKRIFTIENTTSNKSDGIIA